MQVTLMKMGGSKQNSVVGSSLNNFGGVGARDLGSSRGGRSDADWRSDAGKSDKSSNY